MSQAHARLKAVPVEDVTLKLHEHLRNLDAIWIKRCLVSITAEHLTVLTEANTRKPLTIGPGTSGTVELFASILRPFIKVHSLHLTKQPKHLETSDTATVEDSPFRIVFLAADIKTWESSSVERLDQLSEDQRHSPLRHHAWSITVQGSQPPANSTETDILPRL